MSAHGSEEPAAALQDTLDKQRSDLIKLAADDNVDSLPTADASDATQHAPAPRAAHTTTSGEQQQGDCPALTADNLEQIPDADELAPGIRLPEKNMDTAISPCSGIPATETPQESVSPALTARATPAETDIPAELDPRTSEFRPGVPRAGSVFSVAVQPGSPKFGAESVGVQSPDLQPKQPDTVQPADYVLGAAAPNPAAAAVFGSPFARRSHATDTASNASFAPSEAGSTISDISSSAYSTDVREQEMAIDRQRMVERATTGGEVGIGGPVAMPFLRRMDDTTFDLPSPRTASAAATVATSPTTSVRGSEVHDASISSRQGSIDSSDNMSIRIQQDATPIFEQNSPSLAPARASLPGPAIATNVP